MHHRKARMRHRTGSAVETLGQRLDLVQPYSILILHPYALISHRNCSVFKNSKKEVTSMDFCKAEKLEDVLAPVIPIMPISSLFTKLIKWLFG